MRNSIEYSPAPSLADLLGPYRAAEPGRPELVYPLVGDERARRVAAAWAAVGGGVCEWRRPRGEAPGDPTARWLWLWSGAQVRHAAVARAAGFSDVRAELDLLIGHGLIYPDGTIHGHVRALLHAEIGAALRGALGGAAARGDR